MTVELLEHQEKCLNEAFLDKENSVIKNVVLLGAVSKNNRVYAPKVMEEAVPLYDSVRAFANHPSFDGNRKNLRDIRDLIGKFVFPKFEDNKIKADLKLLPNANWVMEIAETMPETVGFSHNVLGIVAQKDGMEVVETIKSVRSVDLVTAPATTVSMFESKENNSITSDEYNDENAGKGNDVPIHKRENKETEPEKENQKIEENVRETFKITLNDENQMNLEDNEGKREIVRKLLEDKKLPETFITTQIVEIIAKFNTLTEIKDFISEYAKLISITRTPISNEKDPESLLKKINESTVDDETFIKVIKKR